MWRPGRGGHGAVRLGKEGAPPATLGASLRGFLRRAPGSPSHDTFSYLFRPDVAWLQDGHWWPGLQAIGKLCRICETMAGRTAETAYDLLSAPGTPERLNAVVRHN